MKSNMRPMQEITSHLYSAVISDTLDGLGFKYQALPPDVRALDDTKVLFGRVRTGQYVGVVEYEPGEDPYEQEIALVDDLKSGDVIVLGCAGPRNIVPWGELLTTACIARKAVGCLTDGMARDSKQIRALGFPVFCAGTSPLDTRGRGKMTTMDRPISIGGVQIRSGDYIFGDCDGAIVIPAEIAAETFNKAFEKVNGENVTRDEIKRGTPLKEVYAKFGVL